MAQVEGRTEAARRQRLSLVDGYGDDATTRGSQPQQLEMNERLLPQQLNTVLYCPIQMWGHSHAQLGLLMTCRLSTARSLAAWTARDSQGFYSRYSIGGA